MEQEVGECAGIVELALLLDGRGRLFLHYLTRFLSATHSPIPIAAAILVSPTRANPDEHTVVPIAAPTKMPAVPAAPEDIPVRLFPRKSAEARTEPRCGKWRHAPVFVNE